MFSMSFRNPNRFAKQVSRLVSAAGYSESRALQYGSVLFLKSVRARTAKAPATRKLRSVKGGFTYKVFRNGKESTRFVSASSRADAKKNRAVIVRYSGLAKLAWGWAMNDLFGASSGDRGRFKRPRSAMVSSKRPGMIVINNRLSYAMEALKGGRSELLDAYGAAEKAIAFRIDSILK